MLGQRGNFMLPWPQSLSTRDMETLGLLGPAFQLVSASWAVSSATSSCQDSYSCISCVAQLRFLLFIRWFLVVYPGLFICFSLNLLSKYISAEHELFLLFFLLVPWPILKAASLNSQFISGWFRTSLSKAQSHYFYKPPPSFPLSSPRNTNSIKIMCCVRDVET